MIINNVLRRNRIYLKIQFSQKYFTAKYKLWENIGIYRTLKFYEMAWKKTTLENEHNFFSAWINKATQSESSCLCQMSQWSLSSVSCGCICIQLLILVPFMHDCKDKKERHLFMQDFKLRKKMVKREENKMSRKTNIFRAALDKWAPISNHIHKLLTQDIYKKQFK